MTTSSFCSPDDLIKFCNSSREEFRAKLSLLSPFDIGRSIAILLHISGKPAAAKLAELFQTADRPATLEKIGQTLNVAGFIGFLDFFSLHPEFQSRLSFILTGLSHDVFGKGLLYFEETHIRLLQQETSFEPLRVQLASFIRDSESLKNRIGDEIDRLTLEFRSNAKSETSAEAFRQAENNITDIRERLEEHIEAIAKAIAIIWHTDRTDLIDRIGRVNESVRHELFRLVGRPASSESSATGLFALLEETCSAIFENLPNQAPSLDGLTRLSIRYLKDYEEAGLLSDHPMQNTQTDDETEHLLTSIQQKLNDLNIGTIGDLKKAHLFSKSSLIDYIREQMPKPIENLQ